MNSGSSLSLRLSMVWIDFIPGYGFNYTPRIYIPRSETARSINRNVGAVEKTLERKLERNEGKAKLNKWNPRYCSSAKAFLRRRVLENSHDKSRLQS